MKRLISVLAKLQSIIWFTNEAVQLGKKNCERRVELDFGR